jgi:hypothetical protein
MLSSKEATLVLIYHPELSFVKEEIFQEYYVSYFGNLVFSLYDLVESETFLTPIILFPQLRFLVFLATLFISFYFSYFSSATNEESVVDTDYLAASATVEAEKEISSFDDMILAFVVLFYIFG